jgi:tRNA(adenine34) deaminase
MREHEPFMHQALSEAEKALAAGEFPVGAVLVYEGEVLLRGRRQHSKAETANELEHAEIVILQQLVARYPGIAQDRLTLYSTMEPCLMCYSGLLLNGIHRIVYGYEDVMGGGTNLPLEELSPLYQQMEVVVLPHILRQECLVLFKKFFADPANSYWRQSQLADYTLAQP